MRRLLAGESGGGKSAVEKAFPAEAWAGLDKHGG